MDGMGWHDILDCCAGGHMMGWQGDSKLTPEQMEQRQYMMGRYMGMQQIMMDHMMQH